MAVKLPIVESKWTTKSSWKYTSTNIYNVRGWVFWVVQNGVPLSYTIMDAQVV